MRFVKFVIIFYFFFDFLIFDFIDLLASKYALVTHHQLSRISIETWYNGCTFTLPLRLYMTTFLKIVTQGTR